MANSGDDSLGRRLAHWLFRIRVESRNLGTAFKRQRRQSEPERKLRLKSMARDTAETADGSLRQGLFENVLLTGRNAVITAGAGEDDGRGAVRCRGQQTLHALFHFAVVAAATRPAHAPRWLRTAGSCLDVRQRRRRPRERG